MSNVEPQALGSRFKELKNLLNVAMKLQMDRGEASAHLDVYVHFGVWL